MPTMATGRRLGSRKVTLLSNPSSIPIASASRMNSTRSKRRRRHNRDQIIAETVACLIRSVPVIDPAPIPFTAAGVAACFCPNVPSRGRKTSGRLHERHLPRSGPFGRVCVRWRATQIAVLDDWHNGYAPLHHDGIIYSTPLRDRRFVDSLLEEGVSSEPVSEARPYRGQVVEASTRGEGAIKKIGINPMHYPLIKCPSGARQAAPQLKDLDTPRRLVIKYKINLLYWN